MPLIIMPAMKQKRPPNFKHRTVSEMLHDLSACGWTQTAIGDALGITQSAVSRLMMLGVEPSYSVGKRLEVLHARVVGRARKAGAKL